MSEMEKSERDLLIEVVTKIDIFTVKVNEHDKDIKGAHRRMDGITLGGILSVIVLGISMWFK